MSVACCPTSLSFVQQFPILLMADVNKQTDEMMSMATTPARNKAIDNKEEGQSSNGIENNDIGSGQEAKPNNLEILLSAAEMNADADDSPNMDDMPTEERLAYLRRLDAAICQAKINQEAGGNSKPFKGQEEGHSLTEIMSGFKRCGAPARIIKA